MKKSINLNGLITVISTLICLFPLIPEIYFWNKLPQQIAVHFNMNGNPDLFVPKAFGALGLPIFFCIVNVFSVFFILKNKNMVNQKLFYILLPLLPVLSILCSLIILLKALNCSFYVNSFITIFISLLFIFIGNYLPKIKRNKHIGIRLPWVVNNDEIWYKTHLLTAPVWVFCGFISLTGAFTQFDLKILSITTIIEIGVPVIYSFIVYFQIKAQEKE